MTEILTIQMGQCGNQCGSKFIDIIRSEHGIGDDGYYKGDSDLQLQKAAVYFNEASGGRFVPRAILVDLEPIVLENIKNEPVGSLYRPDNFISGAMSAANNWARGFYTDGPDILDNIFEVLRKEVETCECLQGFVITHSLGGGTGSGLSCLLMDKVKEEFPDKVMSTFAIIPSPLVSEIVVEPYNSILSLFYMLTLCNLTFCQDNEALFSISAKLLKIKAPTYGDLNHLISLNMSCSTASLRFPGQLNADLRKLATNLVPFPRFHFLVSTFAPLTSRFVQKYRPCTTHDIVRQAFEPKHLMTACDPKMGRYLSVAMIFRGRIAMRDIDNEVSSFQNKNCSHFVDWIPNNMKTAQNDIPPRGFTKAVSFIGNTTAMKDVFLRLHTQYATMFRRRAFLHWYTSESMEEDEFHDAETSLLDIIDDFERLESAKHIENPETSEETTETSDSKSSRDGERHNRRNYNSHNSHNEYLTDEEY